MTVQRDNATGTVSVGVFVVEFDPSYVNVHQGTFVNAQGAAQPTTSPIPLVNLAKAALVFYYRYNTQTVPYSMVATAGWFGSTTQLNWQRSDASVGAVNGHYYVFEARNAEFSVQVLSFALGASATSATASALATPVDPDKTMVIASYRTDYPDDDEDGQFRVALTSATTVTAYRTWGSGSGSNNTPDIRVFVVQFPGGVRVQPRDARLRGHRHAEDGGDRVRAHIHGDGVERCVHPGQRVSHAVDHGRQKRA